MINDNENTLSNMNELMKASLLGAIVMRANQQVLVLNVNDTAGYMTWALSSATANQ